MTDLFTSTEKTDLDKVFDDVHDTFSREIFVYKIHTQRLVGINVNQSYNALYDQAVDMIEKDGSQSENHDEVLKVATQARIYYFGKQTDKEEGLSGQQTAITFPTGSIRLKINLAAYEILKDAKEVEVDGELFNVESDAAKAGLFTTRYYVLYLRKIQ
jgi:hypothetical protein